MHHRAPQSQMYCHYYQLYRYCQTPACSWNCYYFTYFCGHVVTSVSKKYFNYMYFCLYAFLVHMHSSNIHFFALFSDCACHCKVTLPCFFFSLAPLCYPLSGISVWSFWLRLLAISTSLSLLSHLSLICFISSYYIVF